jgi:hypothetical protein
MQIAATETKPDIERLIKQKQWQISHELPILIKTVIE